MDVQCISEEYRVMSVGVRERMEIESVSGVVN